MWYSTQTQFFLILMGEEHPFRFHCVSISSWKIKWEENWERRWLKWSYRNYCYSEWNDSCRESIVAGGSTQINSILTMKSVKTICQKPKYYHANTRKCWSFEYHCQQSFCHIFFWQYRFFMYKYYFSLNNEPKNTLKLYQFDIQTFSQYLGFN